MLKGKMQKSPRVTAAALAAVSLLMAAHQAEAQTTGGGTFQASSFAPTGADLAQPNFIAPVDASSNTYNAPGNVGYQDFVDNGSRTPPGGPGQIFNVAAPFSLNSLTVKGGGRSNAAANFSDEVWTLTLGTVPTIANNAPITVLHTANISVGQLATDLPKVSKAGYFSLTLDAPIALQSGVNYVWMIRTSGDGWLALAKSDGASDSLPNGASFTGNQPAATPTNPAPFLQTEYVHDGTNGYLPQDRTFFLNGALGAAPVTYVAATTRWVTNGNGAWETPSNWEANVIPGGAGSVLTFDSNGGAITTSPTITIAQEAQVNQLVFDLPGGGYTINNGRTGAISTSGGFIDVVSGNHAINVPVTLTSGGGLAPEITANAGSSITIPTANTPGFGTLRVYGGGTVTLGRIGGINLNLSSNLGRDGGNLVLANNSINAGALVFSLNMDATSSMNIGQNTFGISGIYGAGDFIIPAGGTLVQAAFADNYFCSALFAGAGNIVIGNGNRVVTAATDVAVGRTVQYTGDNSAFTGTIKVGTGSTSGASTSFASYRVQIGAAVNLGGANVILDGGTLQATASFAATTPISVTSLSTQPAGSTIVDSKIDTNGFDVGLGAITSAGRLTKINAGNLTIASIRGGTLAIDAGAVTMAPSATRAAGVSVLDGLTLAGATGAWTSTLDLNTGDLIVRNGDAAQIRDQIKQGYNGGTQDGTGGIRSTAAGASTSPKTALGYGTVVGDVAGQPTTGTDVVVRYTLSGDANLDLGVNFTDLVALAQSYNQTGRVWMQGDFNYDGTTNFPDLVLLAQNYNRSLTAAQASQLGSAFAADFALAQSLVPEPTTLGVLAGLAGLALQRRRTHA